MNDVYLAGAWFPVTCVEVEEVATSKREEYRYQLMPRQSRWRLVRYKASADNVVILKVGDGGYMHKRAFDLITHVDE